MVPARTLLIALSPCMNILGRFFGLSLDLSQRSSCLKIHDFASLNMANCDENGQQIALHRDLRAYLWNQREHYVL